MDHRIQFGTKEELNRQREEAFLALSPSERFFSFLRLCQEMQGFESRADDNDRKDNFIVE